MTKVQLNQKVADNKWIIFYEKHPVITFLGILIFFLIATYNYA